MKPRVLFQSLDSLADENADTADEDSSAELLHSSKAIRSHHRCASVKVLTVSLLLSGILALTLGFSENDESRRGVQSVAPKAIVTLDSTSDAFHLDGPAFKAASSGFLSKMQNHLHTMLNNTLHPTSYNVTTPKGLASTPLENRYDGNVCGDDEELLGRLCYKKCGLLTAGVYPYRTTAMSCCKSHPCRTNQKVIIKICGGFDVSGATAGTKSACPHAPGACLDDEELSLGMCFKKCSLLTNGDYPHRSAAGTCCKFKGIACFEPWNTKTAKEFDVGGGQGDGDKTTPGKMHAPIAGLTESKAAHSTRVMMK